MLLHDVSDLQLLQEERNKVKLMKFLHETVSHDMMCPINNIKHFSKQMLKAGKLNNLEDMKKFNRLIL